MEGHENKNKSKRKYDYFISTAILAFSIEFLNKYGLNGVDLLLEVIKKLIK